MAYSQWVVAGLISSRRSKKVKKKTARGYGKGQEEINNQKECQMTKRRSESKKTRREERDCDWKGGILRG